MTWVIVGVVVPLLCATSFDDVCPTSDELVCSVVSEERECNSCVMCILHHPVKRKCVQYAPLHTC